MDNDGGPESVPGNPLLNRWVDPPKSLHGFPDAKRAKPKTQYAGGMRRRWRDSRGYIYEWDYQHGAVEVYDPNGRHLGEFDHGTRRRIKPANPTRRVKPLAMQLTFSLAGYDPRTELLVEEHDIPAPAAMMAMRVVGIDPKGNAPLVDYPLSNAQARDIAGLIGAEINPALDFFFETHAFERAHA